MMKAMGNTVIGVRLSMVAVAWMFAGLVPVSAGAAGAAEVEPTLVGQPAQEALQGVRDSFAWLCQLDPLAAMAAEPSGK